MKSATIRDIYNDGELLHVEIKRADGQIVVGVYELIGWTKPPKDVKQKTERALWVPPKAMSQGD